MNKSELVLVVFIGIILVIMYRLGFLEDIFHTF
jgi:hypothetical protein